MIYYYYYLKPECRTISIIIITMISPNLSLQCSTQMHLLQPVWLPLEIAFYLIWDW